MYDLVWLVLVNDFILKFVAVMLKILLVITPSIMVPYKKRVRDSGDKMLSLLTQSHNLIVLSS